MIWPVQPSLSLSIWAPSPQESQDPDHRGRYIESDRWRHICANGHSWSDCTIFLFWNVVVLARLWPPVQSDQLSPVGANMTSATSLSLSIYNLLLYDPDSLLTCGPKSRHFQSKIWSNISPLDSNFSTINPHILIRELVLFMIPCTYVQYRCRYNTNSWTIILACILVSYIRAICLYTRWISTMYPQSTLYTVLYIDKPGLLVNLSAIRDLLTIASRALGSHIWSYTI